MTQREGEARWHVAGHPVTVGAEFVVRTPLLASNTLLEFTSAADAHETIGRLMQLARTPLVGEALRTASHPLSVQLEKWNGEVTDRQASRLARSLYKYLSRMATRPTPFGLLASIAVGRIADRTNLAIPALESLRRYSTLDGNVLAALCDRLSKRDDVRRELRYRANPRIYETEGQLRYTECRMEHGVRGYHLSAVTPSEEVRRIISFTSTSTPTFPDLVNLLVSLGHDVSVAENFLGELIDAQLLVPLLEQSVCGSEPLDALARLLTYVPSASVELAALREARDALRALDAAPLGDTRAVRLRAELAVAALGETGSNLSLSVVATRNGAEAPTLGTNVLETVLDGVEALHILTGGVTASEEAEGTEAFDTGTFRRTFMERYGGACVPLLEVLDEDNGIPWAGEAADRDDPAPLLRTVAAPVAPYPTGPATHPRDRALLAEVVAAQRDFRAIDLSKDDLRRLALENVRALPRSFAVLATVEAKSSAEVDQGAYSVLIKYVGGCSGAALFGRFCFAHEGVRRILDEQLARESALWPERVLAEIVYLPEGQDRDLTGIVARPTLRTHEILVSGGTDGPSDRRIPLQDLLVSVRDGRVVLWSKSLNCEILPRHASAHNPNNGRQLSVYRFLTMLQSQDESRPYWGWAGFDDFPFLPRITYKRAVLSLARWKIPRQAFDQLREARERQTAVAAFRLAHGLPRCLVLADGDNELFLDLDNDLCVEVLLVEARGDFVVFKEAFGQNPMQPAAGSDGSYAHEIVVPFSVLPRKETTRPAIATKRMDPMAHPTSTFVPGSSWLYLKLYCGLATIDRLVGLHLPPLVGACAPLVDRWFFIRYQDPDHHLRLRFRGDPEVLADRLYPLVARWVAGLASSGAVTGVQYDTYVPEIARYGGSQGLDQAEFLFERDSATVMNIVQATAESFPGNERWVVALRSIHELLNDLRVPMTERPDLLQELRRDYGRYPRQRAYIVRNSLTSRYREERRRVESTIDNDVWASGSGVLDLLTGRSVATKGAIDRLFELQASDALPVSWHSFAGSMLHMHVNRMMRSAANEHELVLYDFLRRHYLAAIGRSGSGSDPARAPMAAV